MITKKTLVDNVLYRWDGDSLIAETDAGYTNIGFVIQNMLDELSPAVTDLIGFRNGVLIGDDKAIYWYSPFENRWIGFTRWAETNNECGRKLVDTVVIGR